MMENFTNIDVWNAAITMPLEERQQEIALKAHRQDIYQHNRYHPGTVQVVHEPFLKQPHRFFLVRINGVDYVGSKLISEIVTHHGSPGLFCSKITPDMLLGKLLTFNLSQDDVKIYYEELDKTTIDQLFQQILAEPGIEIVYPFVQMLGPEKCEINTPEDGWFITEERALLLGLGELHLRTATIAYLQHQQVQNAVVYDPACSTGQFLYELKTAIPGLYTIGQDISAQMIAFAADKADELHHGNSLTPSAAPASCDYIVFRFLNAEVVPRALALELFAKIIPCLKAKGEIILFGHTPVLLNSYDFQRFGFRIKQCQMHTEDRKATYQFYILSHDNNTTPTA